MNTTRKKRHHTVPRFHLRKFASAAEMLVQLDVTTGESRPVSVTDAAVRRDFYTVVLPDGSRSDVWETWLSEAESAVAPAVTRAIEMPHFAATNEDRHHLSFWIALQYLRGPSNRAQMAHLFSHTLRMQVGMGGLAYLQYAMSKGLGREVPLAEAELVWSDITSPEGPRIIVDGDDHLESLNRSVEAITSMIFDRSWARIRFERQRLAISDAPVGLVRGDTADFMGVGIATAPAVTVPLDRRTLLFLTQATDEGPVVDRDLLPTTAFARAHNAAAALDAERFVYFHPDDDPIPDNMVPREPFQRLVVTGADGFANRDRPLDEVLAQIADHVDDTGNTLIADYTWPIPGYRPPKVLSNGKTVD